MRPDECQRLIDDLNDELDQLLYAISHDLRAPLRAIDGFSQAVAEDYESVLDEDGRDFLARIRGGGKKVNAYIDGLLYMSRESRGEMHPEELNLSGMVEEICAQLAVEYEHDPDISIEEDVPAVMDRALARTLLTKLLDNAWKFTGKTDAPSITFGSVETDGERACYLRDNGAGFDMQYAKDRLFGAFQRMHTEEDFPGLGTGLATARRIISRHGGRIWAESTVDAGTTIYFRSGVE